MVRMGGFSAEARRVLGAASVALLLAGCGPRRGSGPVETRDMVPPYFSSVRLEGSADVDIRMGNPRSVRVIAESNLQSSVTYLMRSDELCLRTTRDIEGTTSRPLIVVTMPDVSALRSTGSGTLTAEIGKRSDLEVYCAGMGNIVITTGTTELLAVRILRSGNVQATALKANQAHVRIMGEGNAEISVSDVLNVENTGRGDLLVHGSPSQQNVDLKGKGRLLKKD